MPPPTPTIILSLLPLIPLTYLIRNHPSSPLCLLYPHRSQITETHTLPSTFEKSATLREIVNPRQYVENAMTDTRIITFARKDLIREGKEMGDEEILARFTKGFFGGWTFWVEKCSLTALAEGAGWRVAGREGSQFPGVPKGTDLPSFPLQLSRTALPARYSRLAGGNFMLLNVSIIDASDAISRAQASQELLVEKETKTELATGSYVDFAFGDSRGTFSGCNRFEVLRSGSKDEGFVKVVYASVACNPSVREARFSKVLGAFHVLYARLLFREGVCEVLRK